MNHSITTYRHLSALALLLLIAPAIPAFASLCGARPCPMREASMDCTHMPTLQETRHESHEMDCCQNEGASISSVSELGHEVDECCTISSQDSPEAISQNRIASPNPLQIPGAGKDAPAQAVVIDRNLGATREKPRPASTLFTLHSSFLI